jgi:hypothetical protein
MDPFCHSNVVNDGVTPMMQSANSKGLLSRDWVVPPTYRDVLMHSVAARNSVPAPKRTVIDLAKNQP